MLVASPESQVGGPPGQIKINGARLVKSMVPGLQICKLPNNDKSRPSAIS
jgi:hypothetical protein